ncbi:hypothetical protein AWENTII_002040 [Aspergillus wentii]
MPQLASARKGDLAGSPACGPALRGLVGAIGWPHASSRYAGRVAVTGRSFAPSSLIETSAPSGVWTRAVRRALLRRAFRASGAARN